VKRNARWYTYFMQEADKTILCVDCGEPFTVPRSEVSPDQLPTKESILCAACELARKVEQRGGGRDNSSHGDTGGLGGSSYDRE
jgi:hypothetical protein